MKTTEVALPDAVYEQVEGRAAQRRLTVPELLRQAAEQMIRPPAGPRRKPDGGWRFPDARHLGDFLKPGEDWWLLANEAVD